MERVVLAGMAGRSRIPWPAGAGAGAVVSNAEGGSRTMTTTTTVTWATHGRGRGHSSSGAGSAPNLNLKRNSTMSASRSTARRRRRRTWLEEHHPITIIRAATADDVGTRESGGGAKETQTLQSLTTAVESKDADVVRSALDDLKQAGAAKNWDSLPSVSRRTTFIRELTTLGIKNAEELAIPSVRNDAAFLATVVGITSVVAVIGGQLPGDWGFFVPYLVGGSSLVVLAVGSVAPGLLQAAISKFSSIYPDYQQRLLKHEAAHFLVAYLVGLPILAYSLDIGKEHVNLVDEKLQEKIYKGSIDASELDKLAVVSMAGLAAEGLNYDKVEGQSADLYSLQRLMNRSKPPLNNKDQQNLTRWAVLYAGSLLKNNAKSFEALQEAMGRKAPVAECVELIEAAAAAS